jgi:hypothetical protein
VIATLWNSEIELYEAEWRTVKPETTALIQAWQKWRVETITAQEPASVSIPKWRTIRAGIEADAQGYEI